MASQGRVDDMEVSAPVEHKFGVHELSDVVFVVENHRFHCHKMMLAARSSYFAAMFTSNFKEKNQTEVTIDANPQRFRQLMEILYNGQMTNFHGMLKCGVDLEDDFDDDYEHHKCGPKCTKECYSDLDVLCLLWHVSRLLDLAHRFLVLDVVRSSVEYCMMICEGPCDESENCIYCATKFLLALKYKMNNYLEKSISKKETIVKALEIIKSHDLSNNEITLDWSMIKMIMERE